MLLKQVIIATAVFLAAAADLGLPARAAGPVHPSFLDLVFAMLCQFCGPGGAVFWAGGAGLLGDVVHLRPPGTGMMICATLALFWTQFRSGGRGSRSVTSRVVASLGLLILLSGTRTGLEHLTNGPVPVHQLQVTSGQVAATFLVSILACLIAAAGGSRNGN